MSITDVIRAFFVDDKVMIAIILIALDFVLGVTAALKMHTFRFAYLMDFLRNDVAFKLLPYFAFYYGSKVAGQVDILIPGLDLGVVAGTMYGGLCTAWVASILNSINELGFKLPGAPDPPAGPKEGTVLSQSLYDENAAPPKD